MASPKAGINLEELNATEAWRSLGPNVKRLLALAFESRNLPAVIREAHPALDPEMQTQLAENLLGDPAVQSVVNQYALGITAAKTPSKETYLGAASPSGSAHD